jgi:DHA1 family bicyclomycin/chloramphenicol resistance-like MFS transporter
MTAQGLIGPSGGAPASAEVPEHPGAGSALLGFVQWVAAAFMLGLFVLARPACRARDA